MTILTHWGQINIISVNIFIQILLFPLILGENNVFWINSVRKLAKKWPCDRKLSKIFQKWTDFNLTPPRFSSIMGLKGTFRLKLCLSSEVLKKKREDFKHIYALFWVNRPVLSTFYVFKVWINDNSLTIFCLRHLFLCFFLVSRSCATMILMWCKTNWWNVKKNAFKIWH